MGKPVVKRGRKALETLNKVSPVAIQTAKKCAVRVLQPDFFRCYSKKKYINIIGKKRGKNSRHTYTKKGGEIKECRRGIYSKSLRGVRDVITSRI